MFTFNKLFLRYFFSIYILRKILAKNTVVGLFLEEKVLFIKRALSFRMYQISAEQKTKKKFLKNRKKANLNEQTKHIHNYYKAKIKNKYALTHF